MLTAEAKPDPFAGAGVGESVAGADRLASGRAGGHGHDAPTVGERTAPRRVRAELARRAGPRERLVPTGRMAASGVPEGLDSIRIVENLDLVDDFAALVRIARVGIPVIGSNVE